MATIDPNQDYDIIHTLIFSEASGDCPIRLHRGSSSAISGTVYYRAGTSGDWTSLSVSGTSTTFPVTDTTMQVAHNWNKSGNDYMTPSFYNAKTITSIAISQKSPLTGTMGTYFMYYYARGCSSLTSLDVPDTSSLESVGNYFMYHYANGCSSLTSLDVPDTSGLESVGGSFMRYYANGCSSLTSLAVPDTSGLTSVGIYFMQYYASGCSSLESLDVPDTSGLTSVGDYFMQNYAQNCSSLTKLVLPAVGWFKDNNVNWSVPSGRLGYLKGRVLNQADLSGWKALTASGKTLYTNYIRDPELVYYEEYCEYVADLIRTIIHSQSYNADTKRPITQSQTYQADTFRKVNRAYQYSADTERITLKDYSHSADTKRKIVQGHVFTGDTKRKIIQGHVFTGDTKRKIITNLSWYQLNRWYHVVVRWESANTFWVFIDGVKYGPCVSSQPFTGIAGNIMSLGRLNASSGPSNALYDDLRISSIARSDDEIQQAYASAEPLPIDKYTTCKLAFDDSLEPAAGVTVQPGLLLEQSIFNYVPATQAFNKLAEVAGFTWWIDPDKYLWFCDRALDAAPFGITDTSAIRNVKLSYNRDNYRNRQFVRGGKGITDPQTESFKGNGTQKTFTVGFPIASVPTVTVGGVAKTVGIKGVETGKDWYWNKGDPVVTQDEAATPLADGVVIAITYQGLYDIITVSGDYANFEERQAVEGGTGIYDSIIDEPYVETADAALQVAASLLQRYTEFGRVLSFDTLLTGLRSGQILQVDLPLLNVSGEYLIRKVAYQDTAIKDHNYEFRVEAVSCFAAETWTQFFRDRLALQTTTVIRENILEQEALLRLVQQSENSNWAETHEWYLYTCPIPNTELYPAADLYPC